MRELIQLEIRPELRVHAKKEILVERRRQAQWIVIREQQFALWFDEVCTEQQVVAWLKGGADQVEKRRRPRRVEIPDVGAEKRHQRRLRIPGGKCEQPVLVGGLVGGDADVQVLDGCERLHRKRERSLRKI